MSDNNDNNDNTPFLNDCQKRIIGTQLTSTISSALNVINRKIHGL